MGGLRSKFQRKHRETSCSAVVVAAGSARRMEGIDKMVAPLGDLPILVHTLSAFQDCPAFDEIVVVTREDLLVEVSQLCREYGLTKVTKVVVGGAERIHSVRAGLKEVRQEAALIAIHDGARPLVTRSILEETVAQAARTGAAAPAVPVTDTIKRARGGKTVETVDRASLWAMQTPQIFEAGLIRAAIEKAVADREELTDDCAAVERLGMPVFLTRGSRENLKITTPFDLVVAQAIVAARGEGIL